MFGACSLAGESLPLHFRAAGDGVRLSGRPAVNTVPDLTPRPRELPEEKLAGDKLMAGVPPPSRW